MKAKLILRTSQTWYKEYLETDSPFEIKVCNKTVLEYYLDLLYLLNIKDVEIYHTEQSYRLKDNLNFDTKDLDIKHLNLHLDYIEESNKEMFIIEGLNFIYHTQEKNHLINLNQNGKSILSEIYTNTSFAFTAIESIKDYYNLNKRVISNQLESYSIYGYKINESNVYIGENVNLSEKTELRENLVIGSNTRTKGLTILGSDSVIGNNVIINSDSEIKESVILDNCLLNKSIKLENKILTTKYIIDPLKGNKIKIKNDYVFDLNEKVLEEVKSKTFDITLATTLLITLLPLYLLQVVIKGKRLRQVQKYPFLLKVLSGKYRLCGAVGISADFEKKKAVFSLSDLTNDTDKRNLEFHQNYFNKMDSVSFRLKLIKANLILV